MEVNKEGVAYTAGVYSGRMISYYATINLN